MVAITYQRYYLVVDVHRLHKICLFYQRAIYRCYRGHHLLYTQMLHYHQDRPGGWTGLYCQSLQETLQCWESKVIIIQCMIDIGFSTVRRGRACYNTAGLRTWNKYSSIIAQTFRYKLSFCFYYNFIVSIRRQVCYWYTYKWGIHNLKQKLLKLKWI